MKSIIRYLINIFLTVDQLLNTLLLGHPDETLSSRLGRAKDIERYYWVKILRIIVNYIFFFDKKIDEKGNNIYHCEKSIMPLEQENFRKFIDYEIWSWNKKQ